jgi:uncharacterized protein
MTLVDTNILLYAVDASAAHHVAAKRWLDAQLTSGARTGFAWVALMAFIRITTNPRVYASPLTVGAALDRVQAWVEHPSSSVLMPGRRHLGILRALLEPRGTAANLTTDAHLAALAIEHDAVICSADRDFARFEGLRWKNPIED